MRRVLLFACCCLVPIFMVQLSCSKEVVQYHAELGKCLDPATGFYAYFTPLPPRPPEDVKIVLADRATLDGRLRIFAPDSQCLYPAVAYDPPRRYVMPESLALYLPFKPDTLPDTLTLVELGYFLKLIKTLTQDDKGPLFLGDVTDGPTQGIAWSLGHERLRSMLVELVPRLREQAASYGASAIIDLALFYQWQASSLGASGVYVTARAVAVARPQGPLSSPILVPRARVAAPSK